MCERYINHLPLTRPLLGTWPTTPGKFSEWELNW